MADSRTNVADIRIMSQPRQLTHHMLEDHLMLHFDQINLCLSALPHKRVEMLQRLKEDFNTRTTRTDIYTRGLANNLIKAIIDTCALKPNNMDSQQWRVSYFLSSWQILCHTRPEHKLQAWACLEREIASAPDVMMVQSLFDQICSTHHRMAALMESCYHQANINISITINP